uniref:G-protein coupled receptors family 2 profile 2 domain-containing protein n=1 Tax=Ciona savignyi TaxID=51511 RepID=H2YC99_CIOSA
MVSCSMSLFLGLNWLLAYFMLISTDPTYLKIMNWLFVLCTSIQGVFFFYFICIRRKDMLQFWWRCKDWKKQKPTSVTSESSVPAKSVTGKYTLTNVDSTSVDTKNDTCE